VKTSVHVTDDRMSVRSFDRDVSAGVFEKRIPPQKL